jgi:hypothetical protein
MEENIDDVNMLIHKLNKYEYKLRFTKSFKK